MDAEALHDLTGAYALDALDPDEAREYEGHLAHCARCRADLAALGGTATALAYAADGPEPPAGLRDRILVTAAAERENVVPLRPRWAVPAAVTAVVAVAATVVLAIWATSLSNRLGNERDARQAQERAAAIVGDPAARRVGIEGGRGTLVVTPTGQGALVLSGLNRAPDGKTYEAWVAQGGSPKAAGTFDGGGGDVTSVALARPVPDGATVMVTVEKRGGVDLPTQMPFVTVKNSSSA